MSFRIRLPLFAALVTLVSLSATSADSFSVSAELLHDGKTFGDPSAVVTGDTPATVEVSGTEGYKVTFTVTDLSPDKIQVAATIDSSHGSFAPVVVVRPGQPATVSVGDLGMKVTVQRGGQ